MIRFKLSTSFPEWPLARQTPGSTGVWGSCQFLINQDVAECDYWVVYEGLMKPESAWCPPENTVLVTGEPPAMKNYEGSFLRQFAKVITCHRNMRHPHVIHTQQGLPWMVGARYMRRERRWSDIFTKDYDELKGLTKVDKDRLMSVICSTRGSTEGHRKRLDLVRRLSSNLKYPIDVFIPEEMELEDKWDAIARYRYHICLENSSVQDYWTEKLSDAFLGLSYPIYYGCPNLGDYFPTQSFSRIDIADFESSVRIVERVVEDNCYERSLEWLNIAKALVLEKYNLFAMLAGLCTDPSSYGVREYVTLKPESARPRAGAQILGALSRAVHAAKAKSSDARPSLTP